MTRATALLVTLLATGPGCGSPAVGDPVPDAGSTGPTPKLSTITANVFAPTCATIGCHTGNPPVRAPDSLDPPLVYRLVGKPSLQVPAMPIVDPGNAGHSYLVQKIEGTAASVGGVATRMPLGSAPLADDDIAAIQAWIQAGAPND